MTDKALATTDPQDPLPEANWLWRRVFIFAVTSALVYLIWTSVSRLGTIAVVKPEIGIPAFVSIVKMLVISLWVVVTYYMVAPSAEQITKMMQTAGLLKAGVAIASRTLETSDRKETASTVSIPPQPVVPPVLDAQNPDAAAPPAIDTGVEATPVAPEAEMAPQEASPDVSPDLDIDSIVKGN
jgi:hypothetical protein